MATISAANNEKVYSINKWGGLNEHPDGDTRLKLGEASKMVNWKVTRDGNLKRRPGSEIIIGLCDGYTAEISKDIMRIATYESLDEPVTVYETVSAIRTPGIISAVGKTGDVSRGIWVAEGASVEDGVMTEDEEAPYTITGGVLRLQDDSDGIETTVGGLLELIENLSDDEYLYLFNREAAYAITARALFEENKKYVLSGYLVSAVPVNGPKPIVGMWSGYAGGHQVLLAACDSKVWSLYDSATDSYSLSYVGSVHTDKSVNFIPFDGNVYIQDGYSYYVYNGYSLQEVTGYIPLVAISIGPLVNGTPVDAGELTGEYVNRLCPKRRVWLSPDGDGTTFQLPEKDLKSIDSMIDLTTGNPVASGWSGNISAGTVTFDSAPAKTVNKFEVGYTAKSHADDPTIPDYRAQVTGNLFAELYSGTTDAALFFYGDGTNRILYTGMDYNGMPRADYFPDQYEARIGDANTPVSSLGRHGSTLVAYKPGGEAWACNYTLIELANGNMTPAIYVTPLNRDKGSDHFGPICLVENNPVTASGTELYQWINSSYYTSNLTRDERQAQRISDRIHESLREIDFKTCCMWDDNDNQEFYISGNGIALVWNYAANAWYRYDQFDAVKMCNHLGELLIGTSDGLIKRLTYSKQSDCGAAIKAEWVSGAMDFGASYLRKYSSMLWLGMKPVEGSAVDVCVETDRKDTFKEKVISSTKAKVPGQPFMVRSKIKAKKFVYYRLMLSMDDIIPAVTVTNVDFRVRQTGYSK